MHNRCGNEVHHCIHGKFKMHICCSQSPVINPSSPPSPDQTSPHIHPHRLLIHRHEPPHIRKPLSAFTNDFIAFFPLIPWLFNFFWVDGLWQRRLTTEDAEGTESCFFLCVICALCVFSEAHFQKIIKNLLIPWSRLKADLPRFPCMSRFSSFRPQHFFYSLQTFTRIEINCHIYPTQLFYNSLNIKIPILCQEQYFAFATK